MPIEPDNDLPEFSGPYRPDCKNGLEKSGGFSPKDHVDDFEIIEEIGSGGMGIVYKAYEASLKRIVALKILHPHIAGNTSMIKRFRREAILAANLCHPNIVSVFHIEDCEMPRYFTMEFVQGRSLKQKIEKEGFLSADEAIRITIQICEALQYAHDHNVIHRDIKPSNILLENHIERVKISDFGIAQDTTGTLAEVTQTEGFSLGSPAFMSPEQNLGIKLDHRTDIFSLGVTLYVMLTGRLPYMAQNRAALAIAFREHTPSPPSLFNPEVSNTIDNLVLQMIAVDRKNRYASATVVATNLRRILDHEKGTSTQKGKSVNKINDSPHGVSHFLKQRLPYVIKNHRLIMLVAGLFMAIIIGLLIINHIANDNVGEKNNTHSNNRLLYPDPNLGSGIVAYWSFEDGGGTTAYDQSGNGNHGTLSNVTSVPSMNTSMGNAYDFNGNNSCITIPDSDSLKLNTLTISCWIKSRPNSWRVGVVDKTSMREPSVGYGIRLKYDKPQLSLSRVSDENNRRTMQVIADKQISDNLWHHIVGVYDGLKAKFYIDGILEAEEAHTDGFDNNNVPLSIGNFPYPYDDGHGNLPNVLNGSLDEIRIYNRALSDNEIQDLYDSTDSKGEKNNTHSNNRLLYPDPNLGSGIVAYWSFEDGGGTTAYDQSGNGNHGTLSNVTSVPSMNTSMGNAYDFNGNNSCITIPDSDSLKLNTLTISCWIKSRPNSWRVGVVNKVNMREPSVGYGIRLHYDKPRLSLSRVFDVNGHQTMHVIAYKQISDNIWHHIVGVYDGLKAKFYLDGFLVAEEAHTDGFDNNNAPLSIGNFPYPYLDGHNNLPNVLNGSLDEIRIYNRALSDSEIQILYDSATQK